MPNLSPEEKRALIAQALSQKFTSDPLARYPQLAKAPPAPRQGFDVVPSSSTPRGFEPPIPPTPSVALPEEPIAPPTPSVAAPAAPTAPISSMGDEPAELLPPEMPQEAPPATPEPMQMPGLKDVIGPYTPEAREELRKTLESKRRVSMLPGILSVFGDAGSNSSGMGNIDTLGSIIKRGDEQAEAGMGDFDTTRKQQVENYLTEIKAKEAGRTEATEKDNADPASALSAAKRKVLGALGYTDDTSTLSGAQLDPIIKSYLTKYSADQEAEGKRLTREAMAGEKAEKKEAALKVLEVPGWKLTGSVLPDDQEAKKARDAQASFESFNSELGQLQDLVKKYGTVELTGAESNQMEALVKSLQLTLKNIAQLGVLSASDIPFLAKQIPDVNNLGAFLTRRSTFNAGLDQARKTALGKYEAFMKSRGYERKGAPGGTPEDPPPAAGAVPEGKIKVSNGKETLYIDPADAAEAAQDGFSQVP